MRNFFGNQPLLLLLLGMTVLMGCGGEQPYVSPDRLDKGLVIVLPGIEGRSRLNEAIAKGVDDGGVEAAIEIHDWTSSLGLLYNLQAEKRNRQKAEKLARKIEAYRKTYPGRPVILIGHSGGGAIAVWAAEEIVGDVDGIILLNPALSQGYNLACAIESTQRGIVNFHSPLDWVLLGVGTSVYGTMDREFGSSAGRHGFVAPTDEKEAYRRFHDIPWMKKMKYTGHGGGHFSASASGFVAEYVVPFIQTEEWTEEFVQKVMWHDPENEGEIRTIVAEESFTEILPTAPSDTGRPDSPDLGRPDTPPQTKPDPEPAREGEPCTSDD